MQWKRPHEAPALLEVIPSRWDDDPIPRAQSMLSGLAAVGGFCLEFAATAEGVRFYVRAASAAPMEPVLAQVRAAYPQAGLREVAVAARPELDPAGPTAGGHRWRGLTRGRIAVQRPAQWRRPSPSLPCWGWVGSASRATSGTRPGTSCLLSASARVLSWACRRQPPRPPGPPPTPAATACAPGPGAVTRPGLPSAVAHFASQTFSTLRNWPACGICPRIPAGWQAGGEWPRARVGP